MKIPNLLGGTYGEMIANIFTGVAIYVASFGLFGAYVSATLPFLNHAALIYLWAASLLPVLGASYAVSRYVMGMILRATKV